MFYTTFINDHQPNCNWHTHACSRKIAIWKIPTMRHRYFLRQFFLSKFIFLRIYLKSWLMPTIMQIQIMLNVFLFIVKSISHICSDFWAQFLLNNFFLNFWGPSNNHHLCRLFDTANSKIIFIVIKMFKTGLCLFNLLCPPFKIKMSQPKTTEII